MKRSQINTLLRHAKSFFNRHRFRLPAWACWSPAQWKRNPAFARRIKGLQMGWDITDFGSGDFFRQGLLLFCIRNGRAGRAGSKKYAEKIMIVRPGQETPLHFHFKKEEDIINRGGGRLVFELFLSDKSGGLRRKNVRIRVDERETTVPAGKPFSIAPGQSMTLPTGLYHRFYGQKGGGAVLVGEVSDVNDDRADNRFHEKLGRFPGIVEDEPVLYPLWTGVA
jgi:D-lyxose ketol-isomerase